MATKKATIEAEWDEDLEKDLEKKAEKCCKTSWRGSTTTSAGGGAVYGLGFIGALVYYLGQGGSLGTLLLGILKAIVWPAFLVYHLLTAIAI
jgi:hypothetical protein